MMKKNLLLSAFIFFSVNLFADVQLRLLPEYLTLQDSVSDSVLSGIAGLEISPFTVRNTDSIFLSVNGEAGLIKSSGIDDITYYGASLGAGYEFKLTDRIGLMAEGFYGMWTIPEDKENELSSARGIQYGGRFATNFYLSPSISLSAFGGYKDYIYESGSFFKAIEIGAGARYNFTSGFLAKSGIQVKQIDTQPVFPVFYSHYNDSPFGIVSFINIEKNPIRDVKVSVFIEKFMSQPHIVAEFDKVEIKQEFNADLTAFFNESILNQILASNAEAKVIVEYYSIGKKITFEQNLTILTLARNNMSWDEDERAGAFVSGKDAAASKLSNVVKVVLRNTIDKTKNVNEQYARGIFAILKAYGINYVVDPSSAFTDNNGTTAVDFLQFPYQTILYHGGDCDDLTILNCSMFESLGISSAMITVPGHIYMAYDSGYSVSEASKIADGIYIEQDGKLWIPLEITLCQDTYNLCKTTGMREWKKYPEERKLIPLQGAWEKYKPVSIPESDVDFEIPSRDKILKYY